MKKIFVLLTSILVISGCTTTEYITVPYPVCDMFQPIYFDRLEDTTDTIRQVKKHNATYDACISHKTTQLEDVIDDR